MHKGSENWARDESVRLKHVATNKWVFFVFVWGGGEGCLTACCSVVCFFSLFRPDLIKYDSSSAMSFDARRMNARVAWALRDIMLHRHKSQSPFRARFFHAGESIFLSIATPFAALYNGPVLANETKGSETRKREPEPKTTNRNQLISETKPKKRQPKPAI